MEHRGIYYSVWSRPDPKNHGYNNLKTVLIGSGSPPFGPDNLCHGYIRWGSGKSEFTDATISLDQGDVTLAEIEEMMQEKLKRYIDNYLDNERLQLFDILGTGKGIVELVE